MQLYRQQTSEFEEWRSGMMRELDDLIGGEYDEL
jgi:hypothetical protein